MVISSSMCMATCQLGLTSKQETLLGDKEPKGTHETGHRCYARHPRKWGLFYYMSKGLNRGHVSLPGTVVFAEEGVHQGDPLGPALFSCAIQKSLLDIQDHHPVIVVWPTLMRSCSMLPPICVIWHLKIFSDQFPILVYLFVQVNAKPTPETHLFTGLQMFLSVFRVLLF